MKLRDVSILHRTLTVSLGLEIQKISRLVCTTIDSRAYFTKIGITDSVFDKMLRKRRKNKYASIEMSAYPIMIEKAKLPSGLNFPTNDVYRRFNVILFTNGIGQICLF